MVSLKDNSAILDQNENIVSRLLNKKLCHKFSLQVRAVCVHSGSFVSIKAQQPLTE